MWGLAYYLWFNHPEDLFIDLGNPSYGCGLRTGATTELYVVVASKNQRSDEEFTQGMLSCCSLCIIVCCLIISTITTKSSQLSPNFSNPLPAASHSQQLLLPHNPWQTYLVYWWMQHFGGLTAKRHLGISNAETVGDFDFGKICKSTRKKLANSSAKSSVTYRSKSGKKAFSGSKFLKSTGWGAEFKRMIFIFQSLNLACSWVSPPWWHHVAQDVSTSLRKARSTTVP